MSTPADAHQVREHHHRGVSQHPDARLLAFFLLWESAVADVESLECHGAASQKIDDAIMLKVAIEEAVSRAPCRSTDGVRFLLSVALAGARAEQSDDLDANWMMVVKALEALQQLTA